MSLVLGERGLTQSDGARNVARAHTDEARAGLEVDIVCSIWALFPCAGPGHGEQTVASAIEATYQAAEK